MLALLLLESLALPCTNIRRLSSLLLWWRIPGESWNKPAHKVWKEPLADVAYCKEDCFDS